jgi:hypothetical protein
MDCRRMQPIVDGLRSSYESCLQVERVNFHARSDWHELLFPIGSPEFVLLDSDHAEIHRWFGVTEAQEFTEVLDSLCG